jgi:hypothetical protein
MTSNPAKDALDKNAAAAPTLPAASVAAFVGAAPAPIATLRRAKAGVMRVATGKLLPSAVQVNSARPP